GLAGFLAAARRADHARRIETRIDVLGMIHVDGSLRRNGCKGLHGPAPGAAARLRFRNGR
ncbi:hypothetical protein, partial [Burkholderia gladioli]|uniref:hypothetical protein n=1 Tax=Burkholderia gladioli TaxID=28095 RepID=UPI001ABBB750